MIGFRVDLVAGLDRNRVSGHGDGVGHCSIVFTLSTHIYYQPNDSEAEHDTRSYIQRSRDLYLSIIALV